MMWSVITMWKRDILIAMARDLNPGCHNVNSLNEGLPRQVRVFRIVCAMSLILSMNSPRIKEAIALETNLSQLYIAPRN
jgi:hypothetical protein